MRRSTLALGACALGTLTIPAVALGTSSTTTVNCTEATFTYRDFGVGGQARPTYTIIVDGVGQAGTLEPPSGPLTVRTVPLNLQGVHTVVASTEGRPGINAFSSSGLVTVNCPMPVGEEQQPSGGTGAQGGQPVDAVVTTPAGEKFKKKPKTCATVGKRWKAWRRRHGCVTVTINTRPRKPPVVSLIGHNPRPPVTG